MGNRNMVSVQIRCDGCGESTSWCVRVSRNVPEPLRCVGRGGIGGGPSDIRCPTCGRLCFSSTEELEKATERATSGGWGQHLRAGAVQLRC